MAVLCFDHTRREVTSCSMGCGIIVQDGNRILHLKSHSSNASLLNASRLDDLQEHRIVVTPDTRLFLYTDGVADQFCADDQRKFTRSRLESTLRKVSHLTTSQQVEYFRTMFDKWRGDTPPVDDVLLVGLMPDPCWYTIACDDAATDAA
jgi:serine phosphatase RsbU (regulator of sigma subunit)